MGHAVGSLRVAASMLGWKFRLVYGINDEMLSTLLGIGDKNLANDNDCEQACVIGLMSPIVDPKEEHSLFRDEAFVWPLELIPTLAGKKRAWLGKPNTLRYKDDHPFFQHNHVPIYQLG